MLRRFAALFVPVAALFGSAATASPMFVPLGDLPGGAFLSSAYAVSDDGSVVGGSGTAGFVAEAFRWTSEGGMQGLGQVTPGGFDSVVRGVSGDGSVAVGSGAYFEGSEAFRWTSGGGMVGLGHLAGGLDSVAWAVRARLAPYRTMCTPRSLAAYAYWLDCAIVLATLGGQQKQPRLCSRRRFQRSSIGIGSSWRRVFV